MKAAQLVGPKLFEFVEIDMPTVSDEQCLIQVQAVSICGSDCRHGYGPIYNDDEYPLPPGRPCHEIAGTVLESRTGKFREGQRVIVLPGAGAGAGGLVEYYGLRPRPDDRPPGSRRSQRVGHVPTLRNRALLLPTRR